MLPVWWQTVLDYLDEPDGPSRPWGDVGLWLCDALRTYCITAGIVYLLAVWVLVFRRAGVTVGQRVRFSLTILFVMVIIGTELSHYGDYVHWRLYFGTIAVSGMLWAVWSFWRRELPAQLRLLGGEDR